MLFFVGGVSDLCESELGKKKKKKGTVKLAKDIKCLRVFRGVVLKMWVKC